MYVKYWQSSKVTAMTVAKIISQHFTEGKLSQTVMLRNDTKSAKSQIPQVGVSVENIYIYDIVRKLC